MPNTRAALADGVAGVEWQAGGLHGPERDVPGSSMPTAPLPPLADRAAASPGRHDSAAPARERGGAPTSEFDRTAVETDAVKTTPDASRPAGGPPREPTAPAAATNGHAPAPQPAGVHRDGVGTVAACVLLAGGLKPSMLTAASEMSVLDLPVAQETTLLEHWISRLTPLLAVGGAGGAGGAGSVGGIRVVHCDATPAPAEPAARGGAPIAIRRDVQGYRGPAGVARDACADVGSDAHVLIAEGARYLGCDPGPMAAEHVRSGADITVAANPDGSPAGVYIARRGTLEIVPARGFMDLKEQWLSRAVGRGMSVRVFVLPAPGAAPLRTRAQLLRACFASRRGSAATPWLSQGFTRGVLVRGRVSNLIAPGAEIDPAALLAHTIAMPGARVEAGAVVARSILCPGARVGPGEEIIDAVVTARGTHLDSEAAPRGSKERST